MSEAFRFWLSQELDRRGWSQRELARQSGVSQTQISAVVVGERKANADFCIKAALALDVPLDYVLKLAGVLPGELNLAESELGPITREILQLVQSLPPEKRQEVLSYVRFLQQRD